MWAELRAASQSLLTFLFRCEAEHGLAVPSVLHFGRHVVGGASHCGRQSACTHTHTHIHTPPPFPHTHTQTHTHTGVGRGGVDLEVLYIECDATDVHKSFSNSRMLAGAVITAACCSAQIDFNGVSTTAAAKSVCGTQSSSVLK